MSTTVGGSYDGVYKYIYCAVLGVVGEVRLREPGRRRAVSLGLSCKKPLQAGDFLRGRTAQKKPEFSGVQLCPRAENE